MIKNDSFDFLPYVQVCYDAYHSAGNMNETLGRIRRSVMKNSSHGLKSLMKGKRFIPLRGEEKTGQNAPHLLPADLKLSQNFYFFHISCRQVADRDVK